MRTLIASLAAAGFAFAAQAAPITPSQAEDVVEAAGATLSASEGVGEDAHVIDAKFADMDLNFSVRLGNCDEMDQCGYAMLFSTFELEQAASSETLAKTNSYNDSYPFGRAFVIPGSEGAGDIVGIDYVIDLSEEAALNPGDIERFKEILNSYFTHWGGE
ncbi:YbjN domain-containing protein [Henriciella aquimarina]|uniref:YbjN domain-containing protein n=1 Tax=Henriciella aquimarina TaxID=545261 RepID=UPI0009FEDA80|nr:YbjN domain-containing protein [Henriciella aquimarina]